MAAPSPTARGTPAGTDLPRGFSSKITFEDNATVCLYERNFSAFPGLDGGDAIEQTTMHNSVFRTWEAGDLIDLTEFTFDAAYDPWAYSTDQVRGLLKVNQVITVAFSNGDTLAFWGFLRIFQPNGADFNAKPLATCTVRPTNRDDDGAEQAPVLTTVDTA